MEEFMPAVAMVLCIALAVIIEVVIMFWTMTFSDGKRAGRNQRPYRNEKKRYWLARAYDRGYRRGRYLFHQGDSDELRVERNKKRFGR